MRKRNFWFIVAFAIAIIIWLRIVLDNSEYFIPMKHKFENFDNISGVQELIVPNVIHYVIFGQNTLEFIPFLSILSALKIQQPKKLYIHTDAEKFSGYYWTVLQSLSFANTSLVVLHRPRPTHVFGQPLSSVYHATDVARIQILMECGGIYIDTDTLVLRSLDRFRHFEMALGWPLGGYIGTQVLLAHKDARFLPLWLESYKNYHPRDWYYNAGQQPTQQILERTPNLIHRVPGLFGVQNLASRLYGPASWPQWRLMYTIHLLSRHPPAPSRIDETSVVRYRTPFGDIARWLLHKLEPKVVFVKNLVLFIFTPALNSSSCVFQDAPKGLQ